MTRSNHRGEGGVGFFEEVGGTTRFNDDAVIQNNNVVRVQNSPDPVRNHNESRRFKGRRFSEGLLDLSIRFKIN